MNQEEQYETELSEIRLDEEIPFYNEQRSEVIYKILKRAKSQRVLDVGCGLGKVTVHLSKKGLDVSGIDVSSRLISLAREKAAKNKVKVYFEVSRLEEFDPKEKFDAVLFAGVLEHIEDDVGMMREAKRLLKPDGKIVITDKPTFNCLFNKRDQRIGHLRRYTKKMLRAKLENAGYSNIRMKYYNFLMIFGNIYLKITRKDEYPYEMFNPFIDKVIYLWYKHLENNFIFPIGDRLFAVASPKIVIDKELQR